MEAKKHFNVQIVFNCDAEVPEIQELMNEIENGINCWHGEMYVLSDNTPILPAIISKEMWESLQEKEIVYSIEKTSYFGESEE